MKLYYYPISTYSQKVLIALYEKHIEFERALTPLMKDEARAEFEKKFPLGKIPLLELENGQLVPESTIIIEFLEDHYKCGTRLIPDTGDINFVRRIRFMDRMADLYFNDAISSYMFERMPDGPVGMPIESAKKYVDCTYDYLEKQLAEQTWVNGEKFTMADCAYIPPMFYAQHVAPFNDYPKIMEYWQRAKQRESYKKVLEEAEPIWQGMAGYMGLDKSPGL